MSFPEELDDLVLLLGTTPPTLFQNIEVMERRISMRERLQSWLIETPPVSSRPSTPQHPIILSTS